jgi:hypothetical protein
MRFWAASAWPFAVHHMYAHTTMHRPIVTRTDTGRDKKETARRAAFPQRAGRFRWWWQVQGSNLGRLSRRFYRPLLRATLHAYLPAQTSPDRFRHGDAVRYMYVAAGCRVADSTDSHVQACCRSQGPPKPAGRSTGRSAPFNRGGRLRADRARLPPTSRTRAAPQDTRIALTREPTVTDRDAPGQPDA